MKQFNLDYLPDNPCNSYCRVGWKGWRNFYDSHLLSFLEARQFVRKLGLKKYKEWREYCVSGNKPNNIPSNPNKVYKDKGWKDFGDWLGTGRAGKNRCYLSFEQARDFAINLKLKGKNDWRKYSKSGKRPDNISSRPDVIYKNEWKGWGDFLGTGNVDPRCIVFLLFEEVKKFVKNLKLNNIKEWNRYCTSGEKPGNIPSSPRETYKNEWTNWYDFLGTKK